MPDMQTRTTYSGQHDWTLLLGASAHLQYDPAPVQPGALPDGAQQERIATSKLDRLAADLRALGIQF